MPTIVHSSNPIVAQMRLAHVPMIPNTSYLVTTQAQEWQICDPVIVQFCFPWRLPKQQYWADDQTRKIVKN